MAESKLTYKQIRDNFMEPFKDNKILSQELPELASGLMEAEFGVNTTDNSQVPIIFVEAWKAITKKISSETSNELAVDVCGLRLEYVTEYSESDKSTNIVPQMFHIKTPIFQQRDRAVTIGASYVDTLNQQYNAWRSVYALEAYTGLENQVYATLLNEYGINVMVPAAIYPFLAATQVAGIQIVRKTKQPLNMYNVYEIDISGDDQIIYSPEALVKLKVKNDSKK